MNIPRDKLLHLALGVIAMLCALPALLYYEAMGLVPGSQTGVYSFMWTDSSGRLRVKYATAPTSDTDGTIVGTQV